MVKVGFIVEGETEKIIIQSSKFRNFLQNYGYELLDPVIDATGGGNLLPKNIQQYIDRIQINQPDKIFVLTDLENDPSVEQLKERIQHPNIDMVFIAVKAIEAWLLADTQAMLNFLKIDNFFEEFPEQTQDKPWDRIKEIINQSNARGAGSKVILAKRMIKHYEFSIENSANHPHCPSAKEFIDYFRE